MKIEDPGLEGLPQYFKAQNKAVPQRVAAVPPKASIRLIEERCVGCGACMRNCPTEAIRIRRGKAQRRPYLCIDCGECLRVCEHKAIEVLADTLESVKQYEYRIAVPEPSIYGQFLPAVLPNEIHAGILRLGFDEVYGAAVATERASLLLKEYVSRYRGAGPLISSFCPVVVRLIQLKFPELIDLVVLVDAVLELGIKELKERRSRELQVPIERIGAFYLAGCPARITTIHYPYTGGKTYLDGALAIDRVYRDLMFAIRSIEEGAGVDHNRMGRASGLGIRWGTLGGEVEALGLDEAIVVSEMKHLLRVIEEIEDHKLNDIRFVECRACYAGCAGGPLMVDNPYRGRAKIQMLAKSYRPNEAENSKWLQENFDRYKHYLDRRLDPLPQVGPALDPSEAIEKMAQRSKILGSLPGIDCGSCGAPNCKALADDIVRGEASLMYCIFKLRDAFLKQKKKAKEANQADSSSS